MVYFTNDGLGLNYAFAASDYNQRDLQSLSRLDVYRLTLPKYVQRPAYFTGATLVTGDGQYPVQLLEDVNKVAFKCLDERMNLELSKALMRLAEEGN